MISEFCSSILLNCPHFFPNHSHIIFFIEAGFPTLSTSSNNIVSVSSLQSYPSYHLQCYQFPKTKFCNELSSSAGVPWIKERAIRNEVHSGLEKYCPQMTSGKHLATKFPSLHASSMMALSSCHIHKDLQ